VEAAPTKHTNDVLTCFKGKGKVVEVGAAKRTPAHPFAPWVTINGKEFKDIQSTDKLRQALCDELSFNVKSAVESGREDEVSEKVKKSLELCGV